MEEEIKEMRITPLTIIEFNKILDYLIKNGEYMAQIGDLSMRYTGTVEDTTNGKREMFYIERKVEW